MLNNTLYNLMLQATEESKSLKRIQDHYIAEAGDQPDVQTFWKTLEKDKQEHIASLKKLISELL